MSDRAVSKDTIWAIAITGLMIGITAVMSFTPLGSIILPMVTLTVAFLPAIITTIAVGFWQGLLVAGIAGIFSMIRAFYVVTLFAPFAQNPLISVFPRMMIAVTVFLVFRALSKTKLPKMAVFGISAAVGSITNTVGFLGMIWLLRGRDIYEVAVGQGHNSVWAMFATIITTNAALEVVGNTIIATTVIMALYRAKLMKAQKI